MPHTLDGVGVAELVARLGVARVELYRSVPSTLDVAHTLAATGAPAGTVIVADEQTLGRGRLGRRWDSAPGAGLWLTIVERPRDVQSLDVLALRVGLNVAESLDDLAGGTVGVKWPNDLLIHGRKLGGILIETRWRGSSPDWVAIGVGINIQTPPIEAGTGLGTNVSRLEALERVVPAVRYAASQGGHLSEQELFRWATRDVARSREISQPAVGVVLGISSGGELLVDSRGQSSAHRSGSVTFVQPLHASDV